MLRRSPGGAPLRSGEPRLPVPMGAGPGAAPPRRSRLAGRVGLLAVLGVLLAATAEGAASWSADASISNERKTEVTEEDGGNVKNPSTESIKQSFSLSYELDINTACSTALDLSLDLNREIKDGPEPDEDYDTHDQSLSVDWTFTALWWDLKASWSDDWQWSQDPSEDRTEDPSFNADLTVEPGVDWLPTFSASFKRDPKGDLYVPFAKESGNYETMDTSVEVKSEYGLWEMLDFSATGQWSYTDDKKAENADKEERSWKLDVKFQQDIGERLSLDAVAALEREEAWDYLPDGSTKTDTDDRFDGVAGKVTYQPFDSLELTAEKKVERERVSERDYEEDTVGLKKSVVDTLNSEISYDESLTENIDFKASASQEWKKDWQENSSLWEETTNRSRDYSTSLDYSPLENLTFSGAFDRADKKDRDAKEGEESKTSRKIDDKWDFKGEASVWDDRLSVTAEKSFDFSEEDGNRTTNKNKWDFGLDISLEDVPNLSLTPKYSFTQDRDLIDGSKSEEDKIEIGIDYEINLGDVLTFAISHSYSRSHKWPSDDKATITRDDSTDLTLSLNDFLEGMSLELSFNRKASDESEDDKGPVIDYTEGMSFQWSILDNYSCEFSYDRDRKQDSEDSMSLKSSFSAEFVDGLITVDLQHEYQHQLEGMTKDTHSYLIEVNGSF